ncbi:MAG: hypothetical protein UU67_C0055G0006 [Candidatus Daviesbacteria bacterium GW2011_GWB1_41_5]|uniref:Uncharacterized protein n=1 Tax=Candidatus Daviesbacteria bacterium GW2011_GWB1_41_5 TaxID=1618429 RepID=A0A0G0YRG8_9BACT|nr:MAG: hypothetical protein UU67_C0055G0006 [Candidatus Daviesbacteria bacterium GW2011_GWB1_41_5]
MVTPVKVAKILGVLLVISSAPLFVSTIKSFGSGQVDLFGLTFYLVIAIFTLAIGLGLYKSKTWSVFGLGALGIFQLVMLLLYAPSEELVSPISWLRIVIYIGLFIWFYSSRKRFS